MSNSLNVTNAQPWKMHSKGIGRVHENVLNPNFLKSAPYVEFLRKTVEFSRQMVDIPRQMMEFLRKCVIELS